MSPLQLIAVYLCPLLICSAGADVVFEADFSSQSDFEAWQVYDQGEHAAPSNWHVKDGALRQDTNIYHRRIQGTDNRREKEWLGTIATAGDPSWSDYRFSFDFHTQDNDGIGCVFRFRDTGNYYQFQVDAEARFYQITKKHNGAFYHLCSGDATYRINEWNRVVVRLSGGTIQVGLNGSLLASVTDDSLACGMIGLQTRGCDRSQFDNVIVRDDPGPELSEPKVKKIPGETLFSDEFDTAGLEGWRVVDIGRHDAPSDWAVADGAVHQTSNIYMRTMNPQHPDWNWAGTFLVARSAEFTDGVIDTVFWSTDNDGIGLAWRYRDAQNYYKFQIDQSANFWQISKTVDGEFTCLAHGRDRAYTQGQHHHLRVRALGAVMAVYLDDELIGAVEDESLQSGSVALESRGNAGSHFEYIRIIRPDTPLDTEALQEYLLGRAARNLQLETLALLPGQTLSATVPQGYSRHCENLRLQVRGPDGETVARPHLRPHRAPQPLWRNDNRTPGVWHLAVFTGGTLMRDIPFNVWEKVPSDIGVCAHRGDNRCAPENTIPAFEMAVRKGAHQIEFDVYRSRDGRLVVIHDDTVDRTTNGTGRVQDMTFEQLRALDAGSYRGEQFAGTRIPTLREVLQVVPEYIQLNCHLKSGPGLAAQVTRQILQMDRIDQCFLACTTEQAKEARTVDDRVRICNMSAQAGPDTSYPDDTIDMGADYIQLSGWDDCMPETCARLRDAGVTINYFGTSDPDFFRRLIEAGVQYPLTDNLDAMIPVLEEMGVPMAGPE